MRRNGCVVVHRCWSQPILSGTDTGGVAGIGTIKQCVVSVHGPPPARGVEQQTTGVTHDGKYPGGWFVR